MSELIRKMKWDRRAIEQVDEHDQDAFLAREWLVTNGLGGYASGTVAGVATRRYHGLLIAALPAPLGRMMMLTHVSEHVRLPDGKVIVLSAEERVPNLNLPGVGHLVEFRLESGIPVWRYQVGDFVLEKLLFLPRQQNTVHVTYRVVEGKGTLRLKLLPTVNFRSHDAFVSTPLPNKFTLSSEDDRYELTAGADLPTLRLTTEGTRAAFTIERQHFREMLYRIEEHRGYDSVGDLYTPGYFRFDLSQGRDATLIGSTEDWDQILAISTADALAGERQRRRRLIEQAPPAAQQGIGAELVLAADQFIIRPVGRKADLARAKATGDEGRTVIAGYHWFTDWGRDTMISLEGLTLSTGRYHEAGYILRTFAQYVRDGLIPNMFPEGEKEGLYHTADATLWFFHALDRYVSVTHDRATLRQILPQLVGIYDKHVHGTRFNIGMDPADGLLNQGQPGYQLTWMDAKLGDWVVTPRRGKAVEINALWYNAVRLLERWVTEESGAEAAVAYRTHADQIKASFNAKFWNADKGCLFDVIDGEQGNDPAVRPNQLLAVALPHAVLEEERWKPVVHLAEELLLTPVGLRSLAPTDPEFKPTYHGDLKTRDAAYHQGTVWAWLIGPFIDAWTRLYPDDRVGARELLYGLADHLGEACLGSVSEVFDAQAPFTPRGCCAQAWSVAEFLRCWIKTEADVSQTVPDSAEEGQGPVPTETDPPPVATGAGERQNEHLATVPGG